MDGYDYIESLPRGMYFSKKTYSDTDLPKFDEIKDKLPDPIFEDAPDYVNCYRFALSILYKNLHKPSNNSGYVSNFVDAAFNQHIFMWDTAFMTFFCNILHPYIPGIRSLDNFYAKQFDDGEIPRELVRESGKDFELWVNSGRHQLYSYFHNNYGFRKLFTLTHLTINDYYKPYLGRSPKHPPYLTLDNLNNPIMAWAEMESFRHTNDAERLLMVYKPLYMYYLSWYEYLQRDNGLFVTDWATMDNSPRNKYLGCGVDSACQMALFGKNLLEIIDIINERNLASKEQQIEMAEERANISNKLNELKKVINELMWDEEIGFYFDLKDDGEKAPVKTIAAYWALLSGVADAEKTEKLVGWLNNPNAFKRLHRVPVCSADSEGFEPRGAYWKGSVWAPTNTMVIRGLESVGYPDLAKEIAENHLDNIVKVFSDTGTIWENYPPDFADKCDSDKPDFVGWSGMAPILFFIEYKIGIKSDAVANKVIWKIPESKKSVGCKKYWFGGKEADFLATPTENGLEISIVTKDKFKLIINYKGIEKTFEIDGDIKFILFSI